MTSVLVSVLLCIVAYLAMIKFLWCDRDPGVCGTCGFFSACETDDTRCSGMLPLIPGYVQPFSKCLSNNGSKGEEKTEDNTKEHMQVYITFSETLPPDSELYKTFMSELSLWSRYKHMVHCDALDEIMENYTKKEEPASVIRHMIV